MKLKLVVESPELPPRDVVVTCDATATVGDVARRLAGAARSTPLTLWVDAGDGTAPRVVNPLLSIHESGVRSSPLYGSAPSGRGRWRGAAIVGHDAGMHSSPPGRTVFHPELRAALAVVGGVFPPTVTPDLIPFMRRSYASPPREELLAGRNVRVDDVEVPGWGAALAASVVRPAAGGSGAGILLLHSGGMMFGDRFSGTDHALRWVEEFGVALVTVDYRLAPEHPDPVPFEDCYATLEWFASNARRLGVDPDRIVVAGASAGGGLAAGVALAARDRGGPPLCGQLLDYPMLDDRGRTPSTSAFDGVGVWDRVSNETGWKALLGDRVGGADVSPYAAPARAEDLRGLPPAFIDVGAAEIFRDEAVDYARRLWEAGVDAELHVWPGAFHACDIFAAHTTIARAMIHAREGWLRRTLAD